MTGNPAVQGCFFLPVAIYAKAHLEALALEPVHGADITVAGLAGDLLFNMPLVIEHHVLRQKENFPPRCGRSRLVVANLLLDLGMAGDDMVMAEQALFHRRQPRVKRARHIRVTERTVDGLVPRVQAMAERDRLLGSQPRFWVHIKK